MSDSYADAVMGEAYANAFVDSYVDAAMGDNYVDTEMTDAYVDTEMMDAFLDSLEEAHNRNPELARSRSPSVYLKDDRFEPYLVFVEGENILGIPYMGCVRSPDDVVDGCFTGPIHPNYRGSLRSTAARCHWQGPVGCLTDLPNSTVTSRIMLAAAGSFSIPLFALCMASSSALFSL
ncbi:hypothetical protein TARUN_5831 [Trichoderma arundinaceum]|uniref:Uncharacterized protein n=1 Tax=Trichoderma arundinaceum TaxID=490622 RepID=A0A395NK46_TRIAR|nr:hypothetical protein TARUN_5831 [Trichoderma arundinaceum]